MEIMTKRLGGISVTDYPLAVLYDPDFIDHAFYLSAFGWHIVIASSRAWEDAKYSPIGRDSQ